MNLIITLALGAITVATIATWNTPDFARYLANRLNARATGLDAHNRAYREELARLERSPEAASKTRPLIPQQGSKRAVAA